MASSVTGSYSGTAEGTCRRTCCCGIQGKVIRHRQAWKTAGMQRAEPESCGVRASPLTGEK